MSWTITPQTKVPVDPQFGSVSLLLHGNGANGSTTITDSSSSPKTVTAVGNAQISTAQSKFGGGSIAFDGSGDYLTVATGAAFNFDGNPFTIEMWVYPVALANAPMVYAHVSSTNASDSGWFIELGANRQIYFGKGVLQADDFLETSANAISLATWNHLACVRNGTTLTVFANGISVGAKTLSSFGLSYNKTQDVYIGRFYTSSTLDFNGYIDDLRITKGVARYTANFTPPTAPFPDI